MIKRILVVIAYILVGLLFWYIAFTNIEFLPDNNGSIWIFHYLIPIFVGILGTAIIELLRMSVVGVIEYIKY